MKIFDYEEVKMNWDSFTYPIAVGTPVSINGVLADNSSAHGLIARTVFAKPDGGDTLKIMTGGFIDMEEIVAGYGQELSSAAVQALCGIHFYKEGVCIPTGGSGGGDDSQKWKEETSTPLFSETVTTVASELSGEGVATLSYTSPITTDTIKVTFDGVEYICEKHIGMTDNIYLYGGVDDFTEYPFYIISEQHDGSPSINEIHTATTGTYTVSASAETVTYTDTFKKGVAENSTFYVDFEDGDNGLVCNKTIPEIATAYEGGVNVVGRYDGEIYCYIKATYSFSRTYIDPPNDEVVIRQIVLIDIPNVKTIELYEARVSATIEKISGGGSSPLG